MGYNRDMSNATTNTGYCDACGCLLCACAEYAQARAAMAQPEARGAAGESASGLVEVAVDSGFVVYVEYRGTIVSTSDTCATYEQALVAKVRIQHDLRVLSPEYTTRMAQVGW